MMTSSSLLALFSAATLVALSTASFVATDITVTGKTATELAQVLKADGDVVTLSNARLSGSHVQFGTFTGGQEAIQVESGVILGSGHIAHIDNSNDHAADNGVGGSGDSDLTKLTGTESFDAAALEFEFVPKHDRVSITYVFGSEEYDGLTEGPTVYEDAMAILVNGVNCAKTGDQQDVNVNTVNTMVNSDLFMDNSDGSIAIELHGFTVPMTCLAAVKPNEVNTIKIVVADGFEAGYDTALLLQAKSFGVPPGQPCKKHEPHGKCLRHIVGADFRHPACLVDNCKAGYALDEAGTECCDIHYIQGYRKCEGSNDAMALGNRVCCDPHTVISVRPNGRNNCFA
mmetsp:Transcript_54924/g.134661  ORF Transcript_54924/g.134661 Transcript_54924/m.134661 type:complete len:343 (-) Transcript_54924:47-1075(-)